MRAIRIYFAAAVATLLGASSASAISLTLEGANGQLVMPGTQVAVRVSLDTEGTAGIVAFSVGVIFDDAILSFNPSLSSTTSYALLQNLPPPNNYLAPHLTPYPASGAYLFGGTTDQVNVGFITNNLVVGALASGDTYANSVLVGTGTLAPLANLVFDVVALGDGVADIRLTLGAGGTGFGYLAGGGAPSLTFGAAGDGGDGWVITPEPTTALLLGFGLVGLAVSGRRR